MEHLPLPAHAAAGMLTGGDSAVAMGGKGTCAGGAAAGLLKELISTVGALEHDVAVELGSMAGDAQPEDSSGAASDAELRVDLRPQPAAVGDAAGGNESGAGPVICKRLPWPGPEPFVLN